ncbi:MAG: hypothetical protein U0350_10810 [Caldilineaceae bacterium]
MLDKVTVRYAVRGLLKLSLGQTINTDEEAALRVFSLGNQQDVGLFIAPATANVLQQFAQTARYTHLIQLFLKQVEIAHPTRYYKRWARRLRAFGFTREDAAILALATFSSDTLDKTLGMDYVVTFDQPMINHWCEQQSSIQAKLAAMCVDIPAPYSKVRTPQVVAPQAIIR